MLTANNLRYVQKLTDKNKDILKNVINWNKKYEK